MPGKSSNFSQFWQELKRRKVVRVIIVYGASAFVIIELVDLIRDPLFLPDWTLTLVIVLLVIGFPIAIIFSWIFDITPEGLLKTGSVEDGKRREIHPQPVKRKLTASNVLISILLVAVCMLLYPKIFKKDKFEDIRDSDKISIAVLPFTNMSSDSEQEYFCDGIAEDILNDLTQLEGLHVVARTSSFAFKDKNQDIREIGFQLGAQTIVEGSVRKTENSLRITAQLINVADGYHLWSERYDRKLEDVFAIQNEIAQNIVEALNIKLNQRENRALGKAKTEDVQAYDFYIRGRDYYHQDHHDNTILAIQMFNKAIQKDRNYALAYSGLADSYSKLYMYYDMSSQNLQQAILASQKALELDYELAEAHISRGLALTQNNQFEEAAGEFEQAIQLNPKLFDAFYEYARTCRMQGKHDQAAKLFEKATQIEPDNYKAALFLASAYDDLGLDVEKKKANEQALTVVKRHIDLNPDDTRALYLGALALIDAGRSQEAIEWLERAITLEPDEIAVLYNATCVYARLGMIEEALDYFERAIHAGFASRDWINSDSDLDPIRYLPRFQNALERMH
jgi:adenylate cyclase